MKPIKKKKKKKKNHYFSPGSLDFVVVRKVIYMTIFSPLGKINCT